MILATVVILRMDVSGAQKMIFLSVSPKNLVAFQIPVKYFYVKITKKVSIKYPSVEQLQSYMQVILEHFNLKFKDQSTFHWIFTYYWTRHIQLLMIWTTSNFFRMILFKH